MKISSYAEAISHSCCSEFKIPYSPWNVLLYHFSVRSAFIHHSQSVHIAFFHCSQSIHSSTFVHHSAFVHHFHYHSELQKERTCFHNKKIKMNIYVKVGGNKIIMSEIWFWNTKVEYFPKLKQEQSPVCYKTRHSRFLNSLWEDRFYC
jgi:hypothetical protein